jgi:hypothetical protein
MVPLAHILEIGGISSPEKLNDRLDELLSGETTPSDVPKVRKVLKSVLNPTV